MVHIPKGSLKLTFRRYPPIHLSIYLSIYISRQAVGAACMLRRLLRRSGRANPQPKPTPNPKVILTPTLTLTKASRPRSCVSRAGASSIPPRPVLRRPPPLLALGSCPVRAARAPPVRLRCTSMGPRGGSAPCQKQGRSTPWERLVGLSQPVCLYPGSNKL